GREAELISSSLGHSSTARPPCTKAETTEMSVAVTYARTGALAAAAGTPAPPQDLWYSMAVRATQDALSEELQRHLGRLVGLGQHGGACLNENVVASQSGRFIGHVYVDDPAVRRLQVRLINGQQLRGEAEPTL